MYEITCPSSGETEHLGHDRVISSHRVSTGHVVYLRCTCGRVVMWTSPATSFHPGAESDRPAVVAA